MHLSGYTTVMITADVDNLDIDVANSDVVHIDSSGTWSITGILAKYRGKQIVLSVVTGTVVLKNIDASSALENQFQFGADVTLTADQSITIYYDSVYQGWRAIVNMGGGASSPLSCAIGATFDGMGSALVVGSKCYVPVLFNCTITACRMLANVSGSVVVDVWKDTYANHIPTIADTIAASAKPTISGATKSLDTTLTGWTTTFTAGDVLVFNIDSCSTITQLVITLEGTRT